MYHCSSFCCVVTDTNTTYSSGQGDKFFLMKLLQQVTYSQILNRLLVEVGGL
jgi:hypothetical protein